MFADDKPVDTLSHPEMGEMPLPRRVPPKPQIPAPAEAADEHPAMQDLQRLIDPDDDPGDDPEAWHLPPPGFHTTGSQLRHRLVTPESIEELATAQKPSLISRLLALFSIRK